MGLAGLEFWDPDAEDEVEGVAFIFDHFWVAHFGEAASDCDE